MEKYPFSSELVKSLQDQILKAKDQHQGPYYAAFDADGTLWDSDLGEQFFQHQIDHCQLTPLNEIDPWHYYESTKSKDPRAAYLWLAQINEGHPIQQVRQWAQDCVEQNGARCFQSQKDFIAWLQDQDIEVIIVTASVQWAVEPAARLMGVAYENVMGIKTQIIDDRVSKQQDGPITWRQGKAEALLSRTQNVPPIFCSGNTLGDIALIGCSAGAKLCVQTQTESNGLYQEEQKLYAHAQENNWPIHHFFDESFLVSQ